MHRRELEGFGEFFGEGALRATAFAALGEGFFGASWRGRRPVLGTLRGCTMPFGMARALSRTGAALSIMR